MTAGRSFAIYATVGVVTTVILAAVDGRRGLTAGFAGWALCLVLLVRHHRMERVAAAAAASRITGDRRDVMTFGWDTLFRMAWGLGGAASLYALAGDRLGAGFWVAVLVCYQTVLAVTVFRIPAPPPA